MKMKIEKRIFDVSLETRSDGDREQRVIVGMPIVYDSRSANFGSSKSPVYEIINRGAAKNALSLSDARALYDHGGNGTLPLGRESANTLKLTETDTGVRAEIHPPNTQFARDLIQSIERGDMREMSFAFYLDRGGDRWESRSDGDFRIIERFSEILDVSVVPFAAYPDTFVMMRSRETWKYADNMNEKKYNINRRMLEIEAMRAGRI